MDELISRQAAIDEMEKAKERYFDRRVIIGKMQEIINDLPSAQPEQRWIPCSERLPEKAMNCLFTVYVHDSLLETTTIETQQGRVSFYKNRRYWSWVDDDGYSGVIENEEQTDGDDNEILEKITAWMPLPEPWKGEDDADHSQI